MTQCKFCAHFLRGDGDMPGECYRFPPVPLSDDDAFVCVRPIVDGEDKACANSGGISDVRSPDYPPVASAKHHDDASAGAAFCAG